MLYAPAMPGKGREDKPEKPVRPADGSQGHSLVKQLTRIADALERAYPPPPVEERDPLLFMTSENLP